MEEIWRDIEGYEGLYQVSDLGRVKSLYTNRILKGSKDAKGYLIVKLCKNSIKSNKTIHRLVAQAFIPNPENKPQVNHIDENKTNNMVSNLNWMTSKENNNHGTRTQRISKPIKAIDIATSEYNIYCSIRECARQLGLNPSHITSVLKGRYKQTGGYTFKYKGVD